MHERGSCTVKGMKMALIPLVAALIAIPVPPVAAQASLDEVVRGIEAQYGKMTDLRAELSQTAFNTSLNQVNVGEAPEVLAGPAGSFLAGLGKLREHFSVRFLNPAQPIDAEGNYVLDLTPKHPLPTLSRLILALEPTRWELRKAVVYDQFENTVTMRFTKLVVNGGLPDRLFTFVAPPGVATVPIK